MLFPLDPGKKRRAALPFFGFLESDFCRHRDASILWQSRLGDFHCASRWEAWEVKEMSGRWSGPESKRPGDGSRATSLRGEGTTRVDPATATPRYNPNSA